MSGLVVDPFKATFRVNPSKFLMLIAFLLVAPVGTADTKGP